MTINMIRERLTKPSIAKQRKLSIELTRQGVKKTSHDRLGDWFYFRFHLARLLVKRGASEDIEEAIRLIKEIRKHITPTNQSRMWADTQVLLGTAYELRLSGDQRKNIDLALKEYTDALRFFRKSAYPDLWAKIKYHLGASYARCDYGDRLPAIDKAMQNYKDALQVFTARKHSEHHRDIKTALEELDQEKKALSSES